MAFTPPYQLSRAALRERFGTRRINASAPQSTRDFTPSGRQRMLEDRGLEGPAMGRSLDDQFNALFERKPIASSVAPPPGFGVANPAQGTLIPLSGTSSLSAGAPTSFRGRFQPRGLPTVQQPEMLATLPVSGSPLNTPFQNDMDAVFGNIPFFRKPRPYLGTALDEASKWLE